MTPPSNDRSGDGRLVDGLRAQSRGVAAQIYDVYGTRLFAYAGGLLGDDDLAGRAVRAALLAARASPDTVPDPERFRAWLYALVRDECLSRLGDRPEEPAVPVERSEDTEAAAIPVDEQVPLEPGRLIFHYAVASPDDLALESADLTLRHGLGTRELAEVLGVSAQQAGDLKARLNAALTGPSKPQPVPAPPPEPNPMPAPVEPPTIARKSEPQPPPPMPSPVGARPRAPWTNGATDQRRKKKKADHRMRLGLGAATLVTAGIIMIVMFVVLSRSPEGATMDHGPQAQGQGPVTDDDLPPLDDASPPGTSPSQPGPGGPAPEGSTTPTPPSSAPVNPANSPPARPGDPPSKPPKGGSRPPPPPGGSSGRLSVGDGGCRGIVAPLVRRCSITLTAVGGSVRWAVASVNEGIADVEASGGGTLAGGRSTTVTVTIRPTVRCYASGFGSGSIGFAPGGSAGISYTCW